MGQERCGHVPWQQILDLADGIVSDLCQHGSQIELRIEPVELGRTDQGVHGCGTLATVVGSSKEEVLATESDSSERPFCGAVVDLKQAVFGEARQRTPSGERISDSARSLTLGRQRAKALLHPFAQLIEQWSGSSLADAQPDICRLAADLIFDGVEGA